MVGGEKTRRQTFAGIALGLGKGHRLSFKLVRQNSIPFTISLLGKSIGPRGILPTKLNEKQRASLSSPALCGTGHQ